ncbi:MAG: CopD family protein, partial [Cyanobacteria bacterium REEB65]|nr:CopD family protein [Cyanobacteria bacterium REEB65]
IAVIAWMAGILYVFRLFVYHSEETEFVVKQRLTEWEKRLLRFIVTPAMGVAWLAGLTMAALMPAITRQPWFAVKLVLVVILSAMHGFATRLQRKFAMGDPVPSNRALRLINEVPTLLMIGIVIMVIVQPWSR